MTILAAIPLTRSQIIWSCAYWGVWVFLLFFWPEILGAERVAPWVTLSETVDWVEHGRVLLADLIFWFVIGVAFHWRWPAQFHFGRTEAVAQALGLLMFAARFV